jgi:xanthine/CO dehydrogenase XdhC/CoxF family maturation factor
MLEQIDFLAEGRFTKKDEIVRTALEKALLYGFRKTLLGNISLYLERISMNKPRKMDEFRRRTASEVITSGKSNGCSDYGIVFAALARQAGIPTRYVETLEEENLRMVPREVSGHAFAEVFVDGIWRVYEPGEGFKDAYSVARRRYIPIARGLDFSELFLNDGSIVHLDSIERIRELRDSLSRSYD